MLGRLAVGIRGAELVGAGNCGGGSGEMRFTVSSIFTGPKPGAGGSLTRFLRIQR